MICSSVNRFFMELSLPVKGRELTIQMATRFVSGQWVYGPHQEVLEDLYLEKARARDAGCPDVVVSASDQLILAVEHCVDLCSEFKEKLNVSDSDEAMVYV